MARLSRLMVWLATGLATLALLTLPVSVQAQMALACAVITAMVAIRYLGNGPLARWSFLSLGSLVVCRYAVWRATNTLPPIDQPLNFALGLLLVAAELYCVTILVISLIINADPLERPDLERDEDSALPSVDVFIPTYNEDESILATTIAAAKSLDYPAQMMTIWLLDDGGTDQKCNDPDPAKAGAAKTRRSSLKKLCDDLGARYVTRAQNDHAKAGNLNNGLKHAKGTIVAVFDADHAPFRSFLRETIGHFALDPKLFLVQTPHVFLNPDPIERNLKTFHRMPSENEMFYSVTQRGLDKWNGSFFCGSAALLRREALDVVGGFSGITITEDCETAFDLHSRGWTSVYVDKPLIAGLQPETFESFIGQRSRWCQGMVQLLLLKNPLLRRGLAPIQKLAYLSSMIFWLFPLPRLIFTIAPLMHIFFDVKIFVSSMDEALAYTATYIVVNLMLQNYLYGRVRWPFMSELYEYVQGVYLCKAILAVALAPRSPTFNVTAKGLSLDKDHLSSLSRPFFAIFGLLTCGAATAFYRYATEPGAELMLIVGLWTLFNMVIAGVALGVVAERREPDRFPRLVIERRGSLRIADAIIPVAIESVSSGGCSLVADQSHAALNESAIGTGAVLTVIPLNGIPARDSLHLTMVHATPAKTTTSFGFAFTDMTPARYMSLADLMYGDPNAMTRFLSKRRTHMGIVKGSLTFLGWGVTEPFRALSYALWPKRNDAGAMVPSTEAATRAVNALVVEPSAIVANEGTSLTPDFAGRGTIASAPDRASTPIAAQPSDTPVIVLGDRRDETVWDPEIDDRHFDDLRTMIAATNAIAVGEPVRIDAQQRKDEIIPSDWVRALLAVAAHETNDATGGDAIDATSAIAA